MFEIPIFPTLIHGLDVPDEINKKLYDIIPSLKYEDQGDHPDTTDYSIQKLPELSFYIDFLHKELEEYRSKYKLHCDKLSVASMWSTKTRKGVCNNRHHHTFFYMSFIHYLTEGASTVFYDQHKECPAMWLGGVGSTNALFKPGVNIPVGSMIFFPSWLPHSVEPHQEDYDRYSIAGNVFPEGNINPIGNRSILHVSLGDG